MNTKEEILDKHFSMKDREIEKWKVLAAMEEYAAQFKDSPYQGSAGVWRKASNGKPKVKGIYITRRPTLEGANWIYADVTYNPKYGDTYIDQWENFGLEWLDDSAASPAGDGWTPLTSGNPLPDYDEPMLWITESGNQFVQALDKDESIQCFRDATKATHYRPLPSPPNKSA